MKLIKKLFFYCVILLLFSCKNYLNKKDKKIIKDSSIFVSKFEHFVDYPYFCSGGALTTGYGYVSIDKVKFFDFLKKNSIVNQSLSLEEFSEDITNYRSSINEVWLSDVYNFRDIEKGVFFRDFNINIDIFLKNLLKNEDLIKKVLFSEEMQNYISSTKYDFLYKKDIYKKIIIPSHYLEKKDQTIPNKYKFIELNVLFDIINIKVPNFYIKDIDHFRSKIVNIYEKAMKEWKINTYYYNGNPFYAMNYGVYFDHIFDLKKKEIQDFVDENYLSLIKDSYLIDESDPQDISLIPLEEKIAKNYFNYLNTILQDRKIKNLSDNQKVSLISILYNLGFGNIKKSSLIDSIVNKEENHSILHNFLIWNKASGKMLDGLIKRRLLEAILFIYDKNIDLSKTDQKFKDCFNSMMIEVKYNIQKFDNLTKISKYRDDLLKNINDYYDKYSYYSNNDKKFASEKNQNIKKIKDILMIDDSHILENENRIEEIKKSNFKIVNDFVRKNIKISKKSNNIAKKQDRKKYRYSKKSKKKAFKSPSKTK